MTLLSELIEKGSAHPDVEVEEFGDFKRCSAHGVKIDVDDVTVPEGIDEIGFIAEFSDGEFSEETIDIVISAIMSEVDTTIEIPAAADVQDPRHIVATASSMDCSLALLPPEDTSDEAFDAFIERVLEFARAYVSQGNMSRRILPISSYLEYLFIEVLKPDLATEYSPVDPQVVSQYHGVVTVERADAMKAKLRSVFHEAYGGEDGFRQFALSLMGAIYDRIEEDCAQSAEMNTASNAGDHPDQKGESPQTASSSTETDSGVSSSSDGGSSSVSSGVSGGD